MTYAQLALLALQIVKWLMDRHHDKEQFDAGHDAAVKDAALGVLRQTQSGKAIMERVDALSDTGLDDLADAMVEPGKR